MDTTLHFKLALSMIPGVGGVLARNLVAYVGSVEGIFNEPVAKLVKIPGIGEVNARRIREKEVLLRAEKELQFIEKHQVTVYFYLDENYPRRLRSCPDAPVLFFSSGNVRLDAEKVISVVGTRNATEYGRQLCDELIRDLSARGHDLLVISGLAYGIDIQAHKSALKYQVPTAAVLGHGLDRLYPAAHAKVAQSMLGTGGLVTDFPSQTKIDPSNFLRRNRIIAGLADAVVVAESGEKGGALVTADIAASYDRDVFVFPGRVGDLYSKGCNRLIKNNLAALIESAADLEYFMRWEMTTPGQPVQQQLFVELSTEEQQIGKVLRNNGKMFIDLICQETGLPMGKVSALLLELEFRGVVDALPGKMYRLR